MPTHRHSPRTFLLILAVALVSLSKINIAAAAVPILLQAETMTLTAPMTAGNDNAAMGGRYISPTTGTSSTSPVRNGFVTVNVPAGTYYLWARIEGLTDASDALYVGIDNSFDRIFPSTTAQYEWVRVETNDGSGAYGFSLVAGDHTIQVGYGEIDARLDAVYLTADPNEVPSFAALHVTIEAEAMNRTPPMTAGSDSDASGGQYISPTSGTSSTNPVRNADASVNVSAAGTYYLWARIKGLTDASDALYVGIDTSFDRIFPSTTGAYEWVRVETNDGSGTNGFSLGAGGHTLQVGYGEIGARLDAVYLTDDPNEIPGSDAGSGSGPVRLTIQAESLALQSPMTVGSDSAAMGGQYVSPTSGSNSTNPVREASTTVNIATAGTYYLWARIEGLTDASDALYVGIDNSFDRIFPSTTGVYEWVRVETNDGSGANGFSLGAGTHTLQVGHGEINARLDALYLTDSATDTPTGSGGSGGSGGSTPPPCANPAGGYQGFGANTTGGAGQPVYHVTTLTDQVPGPAGSLRDALSQGNRCIVFDVGGTITLADYLYVDGGNITIDGFTAPSPGITLQGSASGNPATLIMEGGRATSNIVIRGIRHRGSPDDGMRVFGREAGATNVTPVSNVVFDHVSVTGAGDGAIDVTREAHHITIQWSILGPGTFKELSLLGLGAHNVTAHHNLYVNSIARHPACTGDTDATAPTSDLTCEARNNLIWDTHQAGTEVRFYATGNVVNNYYKAYKPDANPSPANPDQTIWVTNGAIAYVSGNVDRDYPLVNGSHFDINSTGNRSTPFPVEAPYTVTTTDPTTAARAVRDGAGARSANFGLDATDQGFINSITLP